MHKAKKNILIVDDDRNFCLSAAEHMRSKEIDIHIAHTAKECLDICSKIQVDIMLLDQKLPDAEGHSLCPSVLSFNSNTKIIFSTAFPSFENAVKAVRAGAFDYLSKPFELEEFELSVTRALRTLELEKVEQFQNYRTEKEIAENIFIGESLQISDIHKLIVLAANADAPVLITGETGSGKNVVARSIHFSGQFKNTPFISINCAALPENLIEAELFGYEKGAFTGAVNAKKGLFEMAEGGTLLLDEIGEMPVALQVKLLGLLDDNAYRRLGGTALLHAQVRIIAATSVDLEMAIRKRKFREDLFYRLGVIKIHLPPLRNRKNDISVLCKYLLKSTSRGRNVTIADGEIEKLMLYDWPGNVRELRNVLERAVILQQGNEISPSVLLNSSVFDKSSKIEAKKEQPSEGQMATLDEIEKAHILSALSEHSGNYSRAARAVGISLSTLKRKFKKYNVT